MPLQIMRDDLLPIFLVAAVGYLLARTQRVDVETVSSVTFKVLTPCLVFHLLVTSALATREIGLLVALTGSVIAAAGVAAWLVTVPFRLDPAVRAAFLIAVMFANAGNYGLSVVMFAFGEEATARAGIYFVTNAVLALTLGVVIASGGRLGARAALAGLIRVPVVYAIAAAGAVAWWGGQIPTSVARPIELLAGAAIPVMLLVLGMQFQTQPWPGRPLLLASGVLLVLVGRPLMAAMAASGLGLVGPAREAAMVESAMPTAVLTTIVALEYRAAPELVTAIVAVSTLLSPLSVTAVIWMLKSGW